MKQINPISHSFSILNEEGMVAFGASLAKLFRKMHLQTSILFLSGDLGAGKTTLIRGFVQNYGHHGVVKSPTYTLVEPYDLKDGQLYHFDFYRVDNPEECEEMGIRDYLQETAICLIEWPEKVEQYLPKPDLELSLKIVSEGSRDVTVTAYTTDHQKILSQLKVSHV